MEICRILSEFNPISPSEFELSNEAISLGKLPEPSLFFTWYCEKAREVEKYSGSVEFSIRLLDFALNNLSPISKIAKRFILATRHSLLRYNSYINSLAAKLDQDVVPTEEKIVILDTLRTIDLKTFETGGSYNKLSTSCKASNFEAINTENCFNDSDEDFNSEDWDAELEILNLTLQNKFSEAYLLAQQSIFFPNALKENFSCNPENWLLIYCKNMASACDNYLRTVNENDSFNNILSSSQCNDFWTEVVNSYLDNSESTYAKEQIVSLISTKCKMAENILKIQAKSCLNNHDDEQAYF